jgi:hypothetical protein
MKYQEALDLAVRLGVVPYWDTQQLRVLFRKRATKKVAYNVTRQSQEVVWPLIINALGLNSRENTQRVRQIITERLREAKRL